VRSPIIGVGTHSERNSMETDSKEGSRPNVFKRLVVSSRTWEFVLKVSEVTEGKVCGPENDETSSMRSVLREGKEPPKKAGGMSNVCMG